MNEGFCFCVIRGHVTHTLRISVIIEKDEDGCLVSSVPEFPGCFSQARNLDELMERIREAVILYLEVESPKTLVKSELIGVQFLEVSVDELKTDPS